MAEGIKGQRAKEWNLVDDIAPRSRFEDLIQERMREMAATAPTKDGPGVKLLPLEPDVTEDGIAYRHLTVRIDRGGRTATFVIRAPEEDAPADAAAMRTSGSDLWHLRAFRELDDAICRMRFNEDQIGLWLLKTEGNTDRVLAHDEALAREAEQDWFATEVLLFVGRTLRRLECTARSLFALVEPGSCFAGSLLELSLAADRTYALDDPDEPPTLSLGGLNLGVLPMAHGLGRLQVRHLRDPEEYQRVLAQVRSGELVRMDPTAAEKAGLVTIAADDIDYEDEVRVAIEERASISPDALTGMEASLRFPAAETMQTKIFGRLSAWQNWIFQRPNAVGESGALTLYGQPTRPSFDWRRT